MVFPIMEMGKPWNMSWKIIGLVKIIGVVSRKIHWKPIGFTIFHMLSPLNADLMLRKLRIAAVEFAPGNIGPSHIYFKPWGQT